MLRVSSCERDRLFEQPSKFLAIFIFASALELIVDADHQRDEPGVRVRAQVAHCVLKLGSGVVDVERGQGPVAWPAARTGALLAQRE